LTVNQFPNVQRNYIRQISGALYAWRQHGYDAAQAKFESCHRGVRGVHLRNVLRGRLAFLKMVRGEHDFIYRRLTRSFNRLSANAISLPPLQEAGSCKMHNVAMSWEHWIERYKSEVFHLLFTNEEGDESSGTAFHIAGGVLATARHNVVGSQGVRADLRIRLGSETPTVVVIPSPNDFPPRCDIACLGLDALRSSRGIPTQLRLPEIGEEVVAVGFPAIPFRHPTLVAHVGTVEALPVDYDNQRFIQVSFQSGGGLSGGCLIDRSGHVLGVMVENVYMVPMQPREGGTSRTAPTRPYGQAVPMEFVDEYLNGQE
jgi:S1-C subfamily serine protease